jgi:hypothetical protein
MDAKRTTTDGDIGGAERGGALEPGAREEMREESPDGLPPRKESRVLGKVVLVVAVGLALVGGVATVASAATGSAIVWPLIILLIGVLGGLPAIAAGILRKKEERAAREHAARPDAEAPRDIV